MRPTKALHRLLRKRRIRARLSGSAQRPRLTVYRSLAQITAQLVDDDTGRTVATATTRECKAKPNVDGAKKLGELIAKKAKDAGVAAVVFDRNGYLYHGRVRAVADAAREAGLQF